MRTPLRLVTSLALGSLLATACGGEHEHFDEVLEVPADIVYSGHHRTGPQVVYLNFDGGRVTDCDGYCSDAPSNRSFVIGAHFGETAIDFPPFPGGAAREKIVGVARDALSPYQVQVVTKRPAQGPYTMVLISPYAGGPSAGVSPLDCENRNPNDIAFVYKTGTASVDWIARAVVHELGHSFGLGHVTNAGDYLHWNASGSSFTRAAYDAARGGGKCMAGDVQDAPAMLAAALVPPPPPPPVSCDQADRVAGGSRYETAALVSRRLYPNGAPVAVVVRGADGSPDALAAGPLARRLGGPLLLSDATTLPPETSAELERLGVSKVILVGGASALGAGVEDALRARGYAVERISGASRFATAAAVARRVEASGGLAFIASGDDAHLVDALAASGPAAGLGVPVLLVRRDDVPSETRQALLELGVTRTIVVGGPGAISNLVMAQLPLPTRAAGATRYETAVAVAERAVAEGISPAHIYLARGDRTPDALAAGASGELVLLSAPTSLPEPTRRFLADRVGKATLLGGTGALSTEVHAAVCDALR